MDKEDEIDRAWMRERLDPILNTLESISGRESAALVLSVLASYLDALDLEMRAQFKKAIYDIIFIIDNPELPQGSLASEIRERKEKEPI